jgi:hypothetical protein
MSLLSYTHNIVAVGNNYFNFQVLVERNREKAYANLKNRVWEKNSSPIGNVLKPFHSIIFISLVFYAGKQGESRMKFRGREEEKASKVKE